ncbi:cytosolic non-specific dipeptidase-like [Drosophila innubila]|uniref:cytosolic non-specific dipeptidase-like n=1 Tax=Drosophila innubila TaxID=198719 RepID=UPI00148E5D4F|nr:cytosolic non-specific dipeptidase-like [Drosophila innubila]
MVLIKRECYINDLWELVAYETVSTRHSERDKLQRAIDWLLKRLVSLNVVAFSEQLGMQIIPDSFKIIRMPKVIIGVLKNCSDKPTVLVYGNLDVEEAEFEEGWVTDPFVMCELGNYLYGRGVALDKGPLLCWLNAIQAYRDAGLRIPINIVLLIESMAHSGSLGLETVLQQRISFFRDVSCVVIATRRWQSNMTPCIVYGSRGLIYYHLEVECANRSLSSCEHSGSLYEALPDLFYLLSSLVDCQMHILFKGALETFQIDRNVFRITEFNYHDFGQSLDVHDLPHQAHKQAALAENWAMPHISIHGVDGANVEGNVRFIIPHKVTGKFSISLAPNQNAEQITQALQQHLGHIWVNRGSPNKMKLYEKLVIPSWNGHYDSPEYSAASRAMTNTYQVTPNFIRDGGALLAPSLFQQYLKKNVLVLPIAKNDSGGCPINERISVENYIMGSQLMTAFMWEYAERIFELKDK